MRVRHQGGYKKKYFPLNYLHFFADTGRGYNKNYANRFQGTSFFHSQR